MQLAGGFFRTFLLRCIKVNWNSLIPQVRENSVCQLYAISKTFTQKLMNIGLNRTTVKYWKKIYWRSLQKISRSRPISVEQLMYESLDIVYKSLKQQIFRILRHKTIVWIIKTSKISNGSSRRQHWILTSLSWLIEVFVHTCLVSQICYSFRPTRISVFFNTTTIFMRFRLKKRHTPLWKILQSSSAVFFNLNFF